MLNPISATGPSVTAATERLIQSIAALYNYDLTGDRLHDLAELQYLTDYIRFRHTVDPILIVETATD